MYDLKTVMSWLEGLTEDDWGEWYSYSEVQNTAKAAIELLKEQEAIKPRVTSVEQRCGNCNKVIEMDGWKSCPWCGKPILWEAVGRSVK